MRHLQWRLLLFAAFCDHAQPPQLLLPTLSLQPAASAYLRAVHLALCVQNNLLEMHALFDYVNKGLLGSRRSFAQ